MWISCLCLCLCPISEFSLVSSSCLVLMPPVKSIYELKQKLLYSTIELESLKVEANEETRKHKEDVKHLCNLLETAYKERDEARDQLQKILNKLTFSSPTQSHPFVHRPQPESPLLMPTKANSSITESNSLSDTYNHHSHGSSPVDSFFDAVNSPDFSSINMAESGHMGLVSKAFVKDYKSCSLAGAVPLAAPKIEAVDARIESYIKGKVLPEKGKLLQTVLEAGPLLQTLLVAGPLPRWRNPPPVLPYKIPPVSVGITETGKSAADQKQAANATTSCGAQEALNQPFQVELSHRSTHMCSASILNFAGCASDSGLDNGWLLNSINRIPAGKRQRFQ